MIPFIETHVGLTLINSIKMEKKRVLYQLGGVTK